MGDEEQQRETMAALEHARGFLRRQVAQELNHLRTVPDLSFKLDTSLAYSQRIGELLRQVEEERGQGNQPDSEGAPRDE
jgi:ribosome-binding factor A